MQESPSGNSLWLTIKICSCGQSVSWVSNNATGAGIDQMFCRRKVSHPVILSVMSTRTKSGNGGTKKARCVESPLLHVYVKSLLPPMVNAYNSRFLLAQSKVSPMMVTSPPIFVGTLIVNTITSTHCSSKSKTAHE